MANKTPSKQRSLPILQTASRTTPVPKTDPSFQTKNYLSKIPLPPRHSTQPLPTLETNPLNTALFLSSCFFCPISYSLLFNFIPIILITYSKTTKISPNLKIFAIVKKITYKGKYEKETHK